MRLAKKMAKKRAGIMKIHSYSTSPPHEKVKTRTVSSSKAAHGPNGVDRTATKKKKQLQQAPPSGNDASKKTKRAPAGNLSPELDNIVNRLAVESGKRTRQQQRQRQQLPKERPHGNSADPTDEEEEEESQEEEEQEEEEEEEFVVNASKRRREDSGSGLRGRTAAAAAAAVPSVDTIFIKQEVIVDEEEHGGPLDPTLEFAHLAGEQPEEGEEDDEEEEEEDVFNNEDDGTSSSTASAEEEIGEEMEPQKGGGGTRTAGRNTLNSGLRTDRGSSSVGGGGGGGGRVATISMTEEDDYEQQDQEQPLADEEDAAMMDDYESAVAGGGGVGGGGVAPGGSEDMEDTDGALTGNRLFRKKVKRKMSMRTGSVSASTSLGGGTAITSSKAKLQMLQEFPTLFIGLRRNRMFLVNSLAQSFELNQRDIILTLRKIKQNESSARLANFFEIGSAEVDLLFHTSVPKIADCLRNFIVWPDDFTMKLNVPVSLRQHFNRIHLILNYLVLRVKQNAVQQLPPGEVSAAYCPIDQCHKLKYLVASTLDGCVCFVSRAFGIHTDDEQLLAQSGFLTKFKTNTNLIAGQNFHNFEDRLANGHDHSNNNGGGGGGGGGGGRRNRRSTAGDDDDSDLERVLGNCDEDNFEDIVSEKISKSRTFKLKNYIENILENFQNHQILSPHTCIDGRTFKLLDDIVVIVGALINLQKQEID